MAAVSCRGKLPGNCLAENGAFMMCNASSFCTDFGLKAQEDLCQDSTLCTAMCAAASTYGGACTSDGIPWLLNCDGVYGEVDVKRRNIVIPGLGVVICDNNLSV